MHQVRGQNGLPSSRYFSSDGIHLSLSGIKRLLDALSTLISSVILIYAYSRGQTSRRKGLSHREPLGTGTRLDSRPLVAEDMDLMGVGGIIVIVTVVRCQALFWLNAGMCIRDLAQ